MKQGDHMAGNEISNATPNAISQTQRRLPNGTEAAGTAGSTGTAWPTGDARPLENAETAGAATERSAGLPPDYEVLRSLGKGTSAVVYLCRERATGREVAIKAFRRALNQRDAQRFHSEADIMAMLGDHPHILTVYRANITPNGLAYLAIEYAPNGSVQQLLRNQRFTERQMLSDGIAMASALATAHRQGIVHRDIKPSNILITRQGVPALSDFGVAANVYERDATGFSIPWAAPEILTEDCAGNESSDIYALAATLFAMVAGRSPYEYGYAPRTENELVQAIVERPLPILGQRNVSPCVASLLARALSKDPAKRPYSAVEFAREMQSAQHQLGFAVTPLSVAGIAPYPARMERAGLTARQPESAGLPAIWLEDAELPAIRLEDMELLPTRAESTGLPIQMENADSLIRTAKDTEQPASVPVRAHTAQSHRYAGIAGVVAAAVALALIVTIWLFSDSIPSETSIQVAMELLRLRTCG